MVDEAAGLEDLGVASEDTHGSFFGHTYDGGLGLRLP